MSQKEGRKKERKTIKYIIKKSVEKEDDNLAEEDEGKGGGG